MATAKQEILRSRPSEVVLSPEKSKSALVQKLSVRLEALKKVPAPEKETYASEKYNWKKENLTRRLDLALAIEKTSPEKGNA